MNLELQDKRILVTGASKGIGKSIASNFLKEGANVCIVSRNQNTLDETVNSLTLEFSATQIMSQTCDCSDAASLSELKAIIVEHWGGLDVVVANVGDGRSVNDAMPDSEQWQKTWDANFNSARLTTYEFMPLLQSSKGNLIFISSIAGCEAIGAPTDYATAKAAINALAINLARKVAPDVRVNVVAPGNVEFPGSSWRKKIAANPEKIANMLNDNVPLRRFAAPEEIADSVIFLSSPRAAFITGSIFTIDGGQTVGGF